MAKHLRLRRAKIFSASCLDESMCSWARQPFKSHSCCSSSPLALATLPAIQVFTLVYSEICRDCPDSLEMNNRHCGKRVHHHQLRVSEIFSSCDQTTGPFWGKPRWFMTPKWKNTFVNKSLSPSLRCFLIEWFRFITRSLFLHVPSSVFLSSITHITIPCIQSNSRCAAKVSKKKTEHSASSDTCWV